MMTADTTAPSYWLNWRFLLCAIWILVAMLSAAYLIWRYEGNNNTRSRTSRLGSGRLNKGEAWGTCSKSVHPVWLLAYRIVAFGALLALILTDTIVHSVGIFYFYTEWTFALVTIYFGLGSSLSIHGCLHHGHKADSDVEQGSYIPPKAEGNTITPSMSESLNHRDEPDCKKFKCWEYALQILFQVCAGAVALTDLVFWFIIYPFLTGKNYKLSFLVICMHSVNAVFLLGETFLNGLRFPMFRIAYFLLYTSIFVVFQWIFHAFVSRSWPYPFLDLSSTYAPIWYLGVGLLCFPCFGIFQLIFKIKQRCLSR